MKKVIYYFYYKLYCFGVAISDDEINEWKPLVTILILEILLLVQILIWYTVYTNNVVVVANPLLTFFPIVTLLGVINYRYFLPRNKWKEYLKEFKTYNRKKRFVGSLLTAFVVLAILISVVASFYSLSQIKWR